jgi:mono/diheme cytochrome c family protein
VSVERAVLLLCVALCGCGRDWRTDLWYQVVPQARENPRPEPEGSVALEARPHLDDRDDAQAFVAPFPSSPAAIERGQALFLERCQACHGRAGHGGGPVSKSFPPAPDLAFSSVRARSDGFLYATVALGGRAMPRVSEGLDERDRWDLVHFGRALQARTPAAAAAPPGAPAPAPAPEAH